MKKLLAILCALLVAFTSACTKEKVEGKPVLHCRLQWCRITT